MAYFGNAMQGWDYIMYLAEKTGDWELYEFAKRMKEEEEKWEIMAGGGTTDGE